MTLALVAELMDVFTRDENTAYAEELSRLTIRLRELSCSYEVLWDRCLRADRRVAELERQLSLQLELDENTQARVQYLEDFIVRTIPPVAGPVRNVRRRLSYEHIDLTSDSE